MPPPSKLAAAPITWGVCELPNWGEVPPPGRVLNEMAAAGFEGTELGSPGFLPDNPRALRAELHRRALQLVGAFFPLPLSAPDGSESGLDEALKLAQTLAGAGCHTLVAADAGDERRRASAGRVRSEDALEDSQWRRAGAALDQLAARCAVLDVSVVFHSHAGTYVETEHELAALLANTASDGVGVCLDTGHLVYGGADPIGVAETFGGRVRHVHVKDVSAPVLERVRQERLDYSQAVGEGIFSPLGRGVVDFPRLVDTLRRQNYGGWWVLEQDVRLGPPWPPQDPAENAKHSLSYLRSLLQ